MTRQWQGLLFSMVSVLSVGCGAGFGGVGSTSDELARGCGKMPPGTRLNGGEVVESCNGLVRLAMEKGGDVALYMPASGPAPIWKAGTSGQGNFVQMQGDGNLVVYNAAKHPLWASGTAGHAGAAFEVQTDGNLVVYAPGGKALWNSRTNLARVACGLNPGTRLNAGQIVKSCNGSHFLAMQADGNFVEYQSSPVRAVFATSTHGSGNFVQMQYDGNLVVYNAKHQPLWDSGTSGRWGIAAGFQNDGNLVIRDRAGQAVWNSFSAGLGGGKGGGGGGGGGGSTALPAKVVGGYWQNWGMPNVALRDVPTVYNVVYLGFALGYDSNNGAVQWQQYVQSDASFIADIQLLHQQGRKVILSVGGWFDLPGGGWGYRLGPDNTAGRVAEFVSSIKALHARYNFDGIDWDLEHGIYVPGLEAASRALKAAFGPKFAITAAAPTYDSNYITLALQLGADFDLMGPQYYDLGLSEAGYLSTMVDHTRALVAAGIPPSKIAVGADNVQNAGTLGDSAGNTQSTSTVNRAWNVLSSEYPSLRGAYVWSINLDQSVGYVFASQVGPNVLH